METETSQREHSCFTMSESLISYVKAECLETHGVMNYPKERYRQGLARSIDEW